MFNFFKSRRDKKIKKQSEYALKEIWGILCDWELQSGMENENIPQQLIDGSHQPKTVLEVFDEYCDTQDFAGRGFAPSVSANQDDTSFEAYFFPLFIVMSMTLSRDKAGYYVFSRKDKDQANSKLNTVFLEMISLANPEEVIFGIRKCMINTKRRANN
ncbi:hypothetical protein BAE46_10890 [Glaciecola punicea]|uniref:hypothetical protein n=1 Tax=Glaciecola punicea TaxID=56804 RepID=UPI0008720801|nr:hypothetical protein [Glaciecola punicea]OFA30468.1 hypothetical protein BAE46_10890 [Glaciecola punicea]